MEEAPLVKLTASNVAKFLSKYWIYRYRAIKTVTTDNGAKFKEEFEEAVKKVGATLKQATPYYPEANGMVERGHKPIKDTLVKMCGGSGGKWREYLPLFLFSDRISNKRTIGFTPYKIIFGQLPVLRVDLEMETYLGIDWLNINTTKELLEAWTKQLEQRDEVIEEAHNVVSQSFLSKKLEIPTHKVQQSQKDHKI